MSRQTKTEDEKQFARRLGVFIKRARRSRGLSRSALCRLSGVSETSISLIEGGVVTPTAYILNNLAIGLNINVGMIINSARGEL